MTVHRSVALIPVTSYYVMHNRHAFERFPLDQFQSLFDSLHTNLSTRTPYQTSNTYFLSEQILFPSRSARKIRPETSGTSQT